MTAGQEYWWHLQDPAAVHSQGGTSAKPQSELLVHRDQAGGVHHTPSQQHLTPSSSFFVKMADLCIHVGSWDDS